MVIIKLRTYHLKVNCLFVCLYMLSKYDNIYFKNNYCIGTIEEILL